MRRAFLAVLMGLGIAAAAVWLLNFGVGGGRIDETPPAAPPSADQVARGAYLARAGNCMLCHTERGGAPFAGGRPVATPFGTVFASNLTPDAETGLGGWSAAHFRRALHTGRSRDGRLLYPAFPYTHYTLVTPGDADALFDYLRSLPPVRRPNRSHELRWPYGTQAALAVWRALYFTPATQQAEGSRTPEWNRGAYLVRGLGHCGACHSARNALGATDSLLDLSGGLIPMQNWYAPSLASPGEASVAAWSVDETVRFLQDGRSAHGVALGPMAEVVLHSTQHLEPSDLRAIAVFLKSLPQVSTDTDPRVVRPPPAEAMTAGGRIYRDHCMQCHGERGEGVRGAYPPLAGNRAVLMRETSNLVQVVLHGGFPPATRGNPRPYGMPPFAVVLNDAEVAAVLSYTRASWGNAAPAVSELAVARQRDSTR
jgi:mono/diheme cytochrome c family protein